MPIRPLAAVLGAVTAAALGVVPLAHAAGHPAARETRSAVAPGWATRPTAFLPMNHVFVIMMENSAYSAIMNPADPNTAGIQHLAAEYGLATNYYGVTHTSLPNYVAAITGSTWGSNADNPAQKVFFDHTNLVDELAAAHVSWKAYMQGLPYAGFTGDFAPTTGSASHALYVIKHDPFMLMPDIYSNPARTKNVVPLEQLATDLRTGRVPRFSWISPDVCNDMHGMSGPACPYASPGTNNQANLEKAGNAFITTWVSRIMHSPAWTGNSAIFVTWDEGSYADTAPYGPLSTAGCCDSPILPSPAANPTTGGGGDLTTGQVYGGGHAAMIVISRLGARHQVDGVAANHYSLLRTIEENFGLPLLEHAGDSQQVHSLAALLRPADRAWRTGQQPPAPTSR